MYVSTPSLRKVNYHDESRTVQARDMFVWGETRPTSNQEAVIANPGEIDIDDDEEKSEEVKNIIIEEQTSFQQSQNPFLVSSK